MNNLRKIRIFLGLTQQRLSALSGSSLATIQNLEAGRGNPSWETLEALGRVLGLQVAMVEVIGKRPVRLPRFSGFRARSR